LFFIVCPAKCLTFVIRMYATLFIFLIIFVFIFLTYKYQHGKVNGYFYWTFSLLALLALRFKMLFAGHINPDEDQWLISANSLKISLLDWSAYFAAYDITRVFTILPLAILSPVLDMNSISSAHLLAIIFIYCFIYVTYRINTLFFDRNSALIVATLLTVVFGLASHTDLIAYNSEYPAITLLAVATYLWILYVKRPEHQNAKITFLIAFVCSLIPFAKEQSAIIVLILVACAFCYICLLKQWKPLLSFVAGGMTGVLLTFSPIILAGRIKDFIFQMQIAIQYSKMGLGLNAQQQSAQTKVLRMFSTYLFQTESLLLISLTITGFIFCTIKVAKYVKSRSAETLVYLYYISILIAIVYTIYAPSNYFYHYGIFLLIPTTFFIAFIFNHFNGRWAGSYGLIIVVIIHLLLRSGNVAGKLNQQFGYKAPPQMAASSATAPIVKKTGKYDELNTFLTEYSSQGDKIVVWGWDNSLYLKYKLNRASRYLYPFCAVNAYEGSEQVKEIYMEDILHFKPRIILELVGEGRFYFTKPEYQIRNSFPQLQQYLDQNYTLVGAGDNFKFYLRK